MVVVRNDIDAPRVMASEFASATFWEMPETDLTAAQSGDVTPPAGFENTTWQRVDVPTTRPRTMQVERLALQNFRCFESVEITLEPGFNLLVGDNGAGKTTVLDALAYGLLPVIRTLDPLAHVVHNAMAPRHERTRRNQLPSIHEDVRRVAVRRGQTTSDESRFPARVDLHASAYGERLTEYGWEVADEIVIEGRGKPVSVFGILDLIRWLVAADYQTPLPVFAYYQIARTSPVQVASEPASRNGLSRLAGYRGWEHASGDLSRYEHWFERKELEQFQRAIKLGVVQAVRQAVLACLQTQDLDDFGFNATLGALAVRRRGGPWIPHNRLSAGVRNMFGLVVDLAVRCATLNPHLEERAAAETCGVVLIDELDLHLHPTWQRQVVEDLRAAFPRIQFIATTHSPLLLSSLHAHNIRVMELASDGAAQVEVKQFAENTFGLSADQILGSSYFGLHSSRAPAIHDTLQKLATRASHGDVDAAVEFLRVLKAGKSSSESP